MGFFMKNASLIYLQKQPQKLLKLDDLNKNTFKLNCWTKIINELCFVVVERIKKCKIVIITIIKYKCNYMTSIEKNVSNVDK